ncbi:hypothetical protein IVG45_15585 [Methylomonas sp. LL1]|uniref:hypothetical protein n=1 Tax=Methylomonas sp. LL1 TaxID=2785785 RepID=UPI0018C37997|nr:hypothetical protein [Methylomonas sp. LL1]QPK62264.1 hypothetical protein IVG45_15585 [Methylomonas sp. LL1]
MKNIIAASALFILLAACSCSNNDDAANDKTKRQAIADEMNQPLDKAKDVEQQILENAVEQKKQLDDL